MNISFPQTQLYTFLLYCNDSELNKTILDLERGGKLPPLTIFKTHGCDIYSIDNSDSQLEFVRIFEEKNNINLNITKGDMLKISYQDQSMSFVYSYNSIFHMSKKQIKEVVSEIYRVLSVGSLAFINFPTVNDFRSNMGDKVGEGEYYQEEYGEKILHSYFEIDEPDQYFNDFNIIYKENRIRNGYRRDGMKIVRGFVDYIIEKNRELFILNSISFYFI